MRYLDCVRLNARVASLAMRGRWLGGAQVAASYDRIAPDYDATWLPHLWPVTQRLLAHLPAELPTTSDILDLGCGTGRTTAALAARYPGRSLVALDISPGMLARTRQRLGETPIALVEADMGDWLAASPAGSAALIFSAWAIGYGRPAQIIRQTGRLLAPGGSFLFVVNLFDTLQPVFNAFRYTMARFPCEVRLALWPRFPRSWQAVADAIADAGLRVDWHESDRIALPLPDGPKLPWLLRTGVLAGFDAVLPLGEPGPVADCMEERLAVELAKPGAPLTHHYLAARASNP